MNPKESALSFEDLIRASILGKNHPTSHGMAKKSTEAAKAEQKKEKKEKKMRKMAKKSKKINRRR